MPTAGERIVHMGGNGDIYAINTEYGPISADVQ